MTTPKATNRQAEAVQRTHLTCPRKLRILVLVDALPVLSQSFVIDHVAGLARQGVSVTVIARDLDFARAQATLGFAGDVQLLQSPKVSLSSIRNFLRILLNSPTVLSSRLMLRSAWHGARLACIDAVHSNWDAVHAHFGPNGLAALLANRRLIGKLIINFHGHDVTALPDRFGWRPYRLLDHCDAIAHSSFVAGLLEANTTLKVHRVTMGVDTRHFTAPPRYAKWPRPLRLLFIGRLVEQKGVTTAVETLQRLRERAPHLDARLSIVGLGPLEDAVRQQVDVSGLREAVSGPVPSQYQLIAQHLATADILVVPSRIGADGWQEAFGRVVIEALACGVPVVGCPSGGLPETIGRGGLVAAGFDADSICDAILALIMAGTPDSWRRNALSQAKGHEIERMHADYLNVIHDLIDRTSD